MIDPKTIPTPEYVLTAEMLAERFKFGIIGNPQRMQHINALVEALRTAYNDGYADGTRRTTPSVSNIDVLERKRGALDALAGHPPAAVAGPYLEGYVDPRPSEARCSYCGNPYGNGHTLRCSVTKFGTAEQWTNEAEPCVVEGCTNDHAGQYPICPVHLHTMIEMVRAEQRPDNALPEEKKR